MKQIDDFTYEVVKGEEITLVCTPFGIPPEVITGTLDPDPASPNPTFTFEAGDGVPTGQSHFFKIECDFVNAPDSAKTVIAITGEKHGNVTGHFSVSILKKSNVHDQTFTFTIVKQSS